MADKTVIIKLDVQEAGAISSIEGLNNSLKKLDKTSDEYAAILKKIQAEETKLASIQKQRAGAQKSVTKALGKQSDATGSATAATMELSRVVSDAPYGIRGMANNITQLVSQLGTASTKAGGFTAALKLMWKSLKGPLGVVFAITAAVSAIDYFYGTATKATKAMSEFTRVTYAQSLVASQYVDTLEDLNTSEYDRKVAVQELIKLVPELKKEDLAYGKNLDKVRGQIALYSLAQASRIEIDKLVQDNSEILALKNQAAQIDAVSDQKDRIEKMTKFISEQGKDVSGFYVGFGVEKLIEEGDVDQIEETFKRLGGVIDKETKPIMDRILELTTSLRLDPEKDKKGGKKNRRDKVDVLGLDSIDIGENKKKMKKVLDAVADAVGVDLKKDPLEIDTNLDLKLSDEANKMIADKLKNDLDNLMLDSKLDDFKNFADKSSEILGAITDFANAEFERELTIEQNKTNALNTELNNRLNNENLSKEQRASIQTQIAQNDEKLRVKQEAIEKKKFKMNKAANIAKALIDTASAAAGVMADSKGDFFARLAQAIPTIAFGLAQVATIARQKFQSSASKTPISTTSGGGAGSARAEPSFNVVGRSGDSLLINAIQAQFGQPLKAYVVSREVTSQQQLDGIIVNQAST
jgi:hypothetical protein